MTLLQPAGTVSGEAGPVRLFRTIAQGSITWCAKPARPASSAMIRAVDGTTVKTTFDGGLYCADLPASLPVRAVELS